MAHNFTKVIDKHLDYSLGAVGSGEPVRFMEYGGFNCTQTYVNTFGTEQSVCNIVDDRFSGVSVRQGSTLLHKCTEDKL